MKERPPLQWSSSLTRLHKSIVGPVWHAIAQRLRARRRDLLLMLAALLLSLSAMLFAVQVSPTALPVFRGAHEAASRRPHRFCSAIESAGRGRVDGGMAARSFFRTFWPDRAEYMVLPFDARRTGSRCAARLVDTVHSAVITIVTESWRDGDIWRLAAMAKSMAGQSYLVSTWWVLVLAPSSGGPSSPEGRRVVKLPKTIAALKRYGARVVQGSGVDLALAIHDDARSSGAAMMPLNVLVDEDFNTILEHTAVEKFVWALEGHHADAVSSWSVAFDREERGQHLSVRGPKDHDGAFMMQSADANFWGALQRITHPLPRSVASLLLCDPSAHVVILPELLFWEDATARMRRRLGADDAGEYQCAPRKPPVNATELLSTSRWRKLTRAGMIKPPIDCRHAASLLLVVPWLEYGGADQFNVNLVRNLAKPYNIHVVVITTTDGSAQPLYGDIASATEDVFHLNHLMPPEWKRPKTSRVDMVDVVAYLSRTRGADVLLLSNSEPGYLSLPEIRRRLPDVTLLDYVHSIALDWRNGGYGRYSIESQLWLDHTLVSSKSLRGWMKANDLAGIDAYGVPNLHVVYVGVDPRECARLGSRARTAIRKKYGVDPLSGPLIAFPARMSPEKNPGRFFAIVERVLNDHPEATVIAVGGGPLLDELRGNITRSGLTKRLISTGALAHGDTLEVLQSADIMMLTSNYEGISLSIFEGMAAGVVPFSTDVGAQHELVTNDTGFLIPLDDNVVPAYAKALGGLLNDPSRLQKMKNAAHARILDGFDVSHVALRMRDAMCTPMM